MLVDDGLLRAQRRPLDRRRGDLSAVSDPADHPRAAHRAARPARRRGARRHRAGVGGRARVLVGRGGRALPPRACAPRVIAQPAVAGPQGADPPRPLRARPRGRVPLRPHPHPRRRLPRHPEGRAGRAARAARRLARGGGARRRGRVRGDRRLPPGAGARGCCSSSAPPSERAAALGRRAACESLASAGRRAFDARRHAGRGQPARARRRAAARARPRARRAAARARVRPARDRRLRAACRTVVDETDRGGRPPRTRAWRRTRDPAGSGSTCPGTRRAGRTRRGRKADATRSPPSSEAATSAGSRKAWALLGLVHIERAQFAAGRGRVEEGGGARAPRAGDRRDELESLAWVPLAVWAGPDARRRGLRALRGRASSGRDGDKKADGERADRAGRVRGGAPGASTRRRELIAEREGAAGGGRADRRGWPGRSPSSQAGSSCWRATRLARRARARAGATTRCARSASCPGSRRSAALLAEAVCRQGRDDEAERLALASEESAGAEDAYSHALVRSVRAKVLAQRGEAEDGSEAERGVARAGRRDGLPRPPLARPPDPRRGAAAGRPDRRGERRLRGCRRGRP